MLLQYLTVLYASLITPTTHNLPLFRYYFSYFVLKIKSKSRVHALATVSICCNARDRFIYLMYTWYKINSTVRYMMIRAHCDNTGEFDRKHSTGSSNKSAARHVRFKGGEHREEGSANAETLLYSRILDLGSSIFRWLCNASVGLAYITYARTDTSRTYIVPPSRLSAQVNIIQSGSGVLCSPRESVEFC